MLSRTAILAMALLPCATAFAPAVPAKGLSSRSAMGLRNARPVSGLSGLSMQQQPGSKTDIPARLAGAVPMAMILSQIIMPVQEAFAKDGELGLLEGKAVALLHPIAMFGLFAMTLWTGYQGLQWRSLRELGDELKPLQDQLKALQAKEEGAEGASPSAAVKELQAKVDEITAKRKELIAGDFKNKHFTAASALLALGVTFSVEGGVDTYMRVGKLFPGPHLFAGAGITVLWAVAAALVPAMQKGDNTARTMHIGINAVILALFAWQIPTGVDILLKVAEKVPWVPVLKVAEAAVAK